MAQDLKTVGLDYQSAKDARRIPLRTKVRRYLLLALAAVVAGLYPWWLPVVRAIPGRVTLIAAQQRCMDYQPAAGQVMFAHNPADAGAYLRRDGYFESTMHTGKFSHHGTLPAAPDKVPLVAYCPKHLRELGALPGGSALADYEGFCDSGIVFLHGRKNGAGDTRLVAVGFFIRSDGEYLPDGYFRYVLHAGAFVPARWLGETRIANAKERVSWDGGSSYLEVKLSRRERLLLFAGRADSADATRFTLPYDLGGVGGTIECRLGNDDLVKFRVLDGPLGQLVVP